VAVARDGTFACCLALAHTHARARYCHLITLL